MYDQPVLTFNPSNYVDAAGLESRDPYKVYLNKHQRSKSNFWKSTRKKCAIKLSVLSITRKETQSNAISGKGLAVH